MLFQAACDWLRPGRGGAMSTAEAGRALNHVTVRWTNGYAFPADVDVMVGELLPLVERLPQVLTQAEE